MGPNELFSQLAYKVLYLMRLGCVGHEPVS